MNETKKAPNQIIRSRLFFSLFPPLSLWFSADEPADLERIRRRAFRRSEAYKMVLEADTTIPSVSPRPIFHGKRRLSGRRRRLCLDLRSRSDGNITAAVGIDTAERSRASRSSKAPRRAGSCWRTTKFKDQYIAARRWPGCKRRNDRSDLRATNYLQCRTGRLTRNECCRELG
jgi:hypothetical protein